MSKEQGRSGKRKLTTDEVINRAERQRAARAEYLRVIASERKMFPLTALNDMKPPFQRPFSPAHVAKIVDDWKPWRFDDPLVVICSDGRQFLDDGQHRVKAAILVMGEDAEVLCRVAYTDLPGEEFVAVNKTRRTVSALHIWKAKRDDGGEDVLRLEEIALAHGFTIGQGGHGVRTINAINTLTDMYDQDQKALDATLDVINYVVEQRGGETGWTKASVMQAIWYVIKNYDVDIASLKDKLKRVTPEQAAPYNANDAAKNAPHVINIYNKNKRTKKIINQRTETSA